MAVQEFKAESKKLLDLMINSIYTHKRHPTEAPVPKICYLCIASG